MEDAQFFCAWYAANFKKSTSHICSPMTNLSSTVIIYNAIQRKNLDQAAIWIFTGYFLFLLQHLTFIEPLCNFSYNFYSSLFLHVLARLHYMPKTTYALGFSFSFLIDLEISFLMPTISQTEGSH